MNTPIGNLDSRASYIRVRLHALDPGTSTLFTAEELGVPDLLTARKRVSTIILRWLGTKRFTTEITERGLRVRRLRVLQE